jgi:TonB family protein
MSSVVKENEILTSIPETASARPQPVALEVSVTVNGARTVAGSDKREPFSESTKTVLIFGHGAVVRLSSSVAPGQLLFLTNEKTKKEVVCQVVKSKNYSNVSGYVELEFTEPVAGFWGMRFPTPGASSQVSQSSSPVSATQSKTSTGSSSIESKPPASISPSRSDTKVPASSLPGTPAPSVTAHPASTSQPAASSQRSSNDTLAGSANVTAASKTPTVSTTSANKISNVVEIPRPKSPASETSISAAKPSTKPSKSILDSDEVKIPSWLEPLARNAAVASAALPEIPAKEPPAYHDDIAEVEDAPITEAASLSETDTYAVPAPTFGGQLLLDESERLESNAAGGSSKKVLIGVAAGLLALAGAGGWYLYQRSNNPQTSIGTAITTGANSTQTQPPASAASTAPTNPSGSYTAVATPTPGASANTPPLTNANSVEAANPSSNLNKRLTTVDTPVAAVPQPKKPSLGEVNLSAPTVNKSAVAQISADEGLNLSASSQTELGLASGLSVSNSRQPAAPPAPLPVGGDVKPARLLSSVAPVYPAIAKAQRVAGSVKVDALVDATGHVTSMNIVSGPALLQQAAMDALRHWRYEPAQLDGKAVAMHLTVSVQFKLQ